MASGSRRQEHLIQPRPAGRATKYIRRDYRGRGTQRGLRVSTKETITDGDGWHLYREARDGHVYFEQRGPEARVKVRIPPGVIVGLIEHPPRPPREFCEA